MLRRLRFAASVLFAVVCMSLIALWVRSYYYLDDLSEPISRARGIQLTSVEGQVRVSINKLNPAVAIRWSDWDLFSVESKSGYAQSEVESTKWGFVFAAMDYWAIWAPHWFLVLISASAACLPWIPRRFSLRTMLLATTLAAVVLGLVG